MSETVVRAASLYRRAIEVGHLGPEVRLVALEWALFFAADGTRTVAELGRVVRADESARDRAITHLVTLGLIAEAPVSAVEYVQALAATDDREERTLREFLVQAMASPSAPSDAPPANPSPLAARPVRLPPLAFKPLPLERKEERTMTPTRRLSLRALMNVIERRAGSREAGQLDIYRVFIKVDTLLLKRAGIDTLRFTEDRLVADPELERAILRSVQKTLGMEPPDEVWVNVA